MMSVRSRLTLLWLSLLTGPVWLAACDDTPTDAPPADPERVIVMGSDAGEILIVRPGLEGRLGVEEVIPIPVSLWRGMTLSPDSSRIHFNAGPLRLHTFDVGRREVTASRNTQDIQFPGEPMTGFGGGDLSMATDPSGSALYADPMWAGDQPGIGIVASADLEGIGFIGPLLLSGGLTTVPPSMHFPEGRVVALGRRPQQPDTSPGHLFLINPETRTVVDSLLAEVPGQAFYQVEASPDGRHVYAVRENLIRRYDLVDRTVTEEIAMGSAGRIRLSADGERLYINEARYGVGSVGPDRIVALAADLTPLGTLDLSSYLNDSRWALLVRDIAESPDGERIYILSGTERITRVGPLQQARVFVIRRSDGFVERVIPLERWGVRRIFVTEKAGG